MIIVTQEKIDKIYRQMHVIASFVSKVVQYQSEFS